MRSTPVRTTESPRTTWKYSGNRIMAPKSDAPRKNVVAEAAAKARLA